MLFAGSRHVYRQERAKALLKVYFYRSCSPGDRRNALARQ